MRDQQVFISSRIKKERSSKGWFQSKIMKRGSRVDSFPDLVQAYSGFRFKWADLKGANPDRSYRNS